MELESCPFCHTVRARVVFDHDSGAVFVVCENCGAQSGPEYPAETAKKGMGLPDAQSVLEELATAIDAVREYWNDRG